MTSARRTSGPNM